jgi:hypothetical protein
MSASAVIGALRVNLGLDSANFQTAISKSKASLKSLNVAAAAAGAVIASMGVAIGAAARRGADDIDRAAKAGRRLETSVAGFRALEMAAGEAGVSLSTITDSIQTMDREVAKGSKASVAAMRQLGLSASDLVGLEADQKVALIADRISDLGLSSGEASVVLQALGVRNREFVLAVISGGDALRAARRDIEDYGLSVSEVDASRIEAANDAIGRLSLIGKKLSQDLAIAVVPALGALAQVMTDSLREGGFLRAVIDGLVSALPHLTAYATAFVGVMVVWKGAALAARSATLLLTISLARLRVALARTGVGLVVVAMGELGLQVLQVIQKVGGLAAAWYMLKAKFFEVLRSMAGGWVEFTWSIADGMNSMFGTSLAGMDAGITQRLGLMQVAAEDAASAAASISVSTEDSTKIFKRFGDAGAGAGKKVKKGLSDAQKEAQKFSDAIRDSVKDAVGGAVDWMLDGFSGGFKGLFDIAKNTLKQIISMFAKNRVMLSLGLGGSVSGAGSAMAGSALSGSAGGGAAGTLGLLGSAGSFFGSIGSGASGLVTSMFGAGGGIGAAGTYLSSVFGSAATSIGAAGAAIGAAIPIIGAVGLAFSFFKKKTTLLDSGLRLTISEMDTLVETFNKTKTSKYFGLSKKVRESFSAADAAIAAPIQQAVSDIASSVSGMADLIGIAGTEALEDFSTQIKISTKGMSDADAQAAITAGFETLSDEMARQILAVGEGFVADVPEAATGPLGSVVGNIKGALGSLFGGLLGTANAATNALADFTSKYAKTSETATATLTRLSAALSSANVWMGRLGKTVYDTSLAGADAASKWADVFGSIEGMSDSVSAYYGGFYSNSERLAQAKEELSSALSGLGIDILPASRNAFRALVDAAFGSGDTDLAAKLIQLAPAMAEITDQATALTSALQTLDRQSLFRTSADALYAATSEGDRGTLASGDATVQGLLAEVVRAIREGDINNARLTTRLLSVQERANLDPTA